jgi:tRNA U34 5-carboxymethylaminomethyl modifying GTPase MnmE/TrmE
MGGFLASVLPNHAAGVGIIRFSGCNALRITSQHKGKIDFANSCFETGKKMIWDHQNVA